VEPISSAILRIELADTRKAEDWKKHWKCLEENGYYAIYLVSDEGIGISTAHKEALVDIIRQPDTYHAIAHQLGYWVEFLKNAAYKAIKEEYDRYDKIDSAKTDNVMDKRIEQHEKAQKIANEKIEMYDSYHFLYSCLIEELKIFDNKGNLRARERAELNIYAGLDLLETLGDAKLTKVVDKIRRTMPELLNYFDVAKSIVDELMTLSVDQEALRALCLAWQYRKGVIKAKKANHRQYCSMMERFYLELAADYLQESYDLIKVQADMKLDQIVQSSSLVECINSIIRPYLNNSKNQITQETLNLIMFYHNHRRYTDGKRKEKTPIEILTGKKQEKDWIELILDILEEKNPSFFACSR
jgi:ABC-type transporter MlaC component